MRWIIAWCGVWALGAASACGGVATAGADAGGGGDAGGAAADGASPAPEDASPPSDAAELDAGSDAAVLVAAPGACDPPCGAGDFCYALVRSGGRPVTPSHLPLDPLDAGASDGSPGCYPDPSACGAANPSCACLVQAVDAQCHAAYYDAKLQCAVDDAGRPTVTCLVMLP